MLPKCQTREAERKCKAINSIKITIRTPKRYFFVKNESNIRFCYLIPRNGEADSMQPKYIVFALIDYDDVTHAARLLVDAGLIDEYFSCKYDDSFFNIKLYRFSCYLHKNNKGKCLWCKAKKEIEWADLNLTESDARNFIAHFQYNQPEIKEVKVIRLNPTNSTSNVA